MAINILGSNREPLFQVAEQELDDMRTAHVLVSDPRRSRPRWFDGRFLAARDLENEQNYFLVRQADLGRAGGTGIIEGLFVSEIASSKTRASQVKISAGYGFTDTGEMVVIPEDLQIDPANIPEMQRLDAAFGLQQIPTEPGRSRTGLYVIALRPVEWTANPVSAYPTSLTGGRTVQDGDIIEGVVVSLVPYADNGGDDWSRRRAKVAREIFLKGRDRGLASGALPLGIVALRANQIVWLDPYLARRDAGAERPAGMDFGFGQRALREAQLLQYDNHLTDVMDTLNGKGFEATAWFDALPPVGRLPAQTINADALTHQFFPPSMTVKFAFVPEDEMSALIEECLLLPALDLTVGAEMLQGVSVMILAPVKRKEFVTHYSTLGGRTLKLAAPVREIKGNTRALEFSLNYLRENKVIDESADETVVEATREWSDLLKKMQKNKLFWYVRLRHIPTAANIAGAAVDATHPQKADPYRFSNLLQSDRDLRDNWVKIQENASPEVELLLSRLKRTAILEQPQLIKSVLAEAAAADKTNTEDIIKILAPLASPDFGKGLEIISKVDSSLTEKLSSDKIAGSGCLTVVDRLVFNVSEEKREEIIAAVKEAARKPGTFTESVLNLKSLYGGSPS